MDEIKRISELDHLSIEIIQSEEDKEKKIEEKWAESQRSVGNNLKTNYGSPRGRRDQVSGRKISW